MKRLIKFGLWGLATISALLALAVLMLSLFFSYFIGEPSKDEVARVVSPNGKLDAVLIETNGGATTSFGYEIHVLEHGRHPSNSPIVSLYGAVRNQNAYGANLRWEAIDLLAVEFLSARSSDIKKRVISIGDQQVKLAVRDGISDSTAPPGGMLFNLQNRW